MKGSKSCSYWTNKLTPCSGNSIESVSAQLFGFEQHDDRMPLARWMAEPPEDGPWNALGFFVNRGRMSVAFSSLDLGQPISRL